VTNAKAGSLLQNSAQFWAYPALGVGMWATMFVLCYSMSLLLVQALVARSALSWIVGQPAFSEAPVRGANLRLRLAPRLTLPAIHADVQAERS